MNGIREGLCLGILFTKDKNKKGRNLKWMTCL